MKLKEQFTKSGCNCLPIEKNFRNKTATNRKHGLNLVQDPPPPRENETEREKKDTTKYTS